MMKTRLTLNTVLPQLQRVRKQPDGSYLASCPCPDHGRKRGDIHPSLHLSESPDGTLLWKCFAGCSQDAVREALERLAGVQPAPAPTPAPRHNAERQPATPPAPPLTLTALATAKRLDAEKLRAWHVREIPAGHAPEAPNGGIAIPYLTRENKQHAVRYRLALEGDNRFKWRKGDTAILYGLWRLREWTSSDALHLCEGESDTWTLWHADLPALGVPSANIWNSEWWQLLKRFRRIVILPDRDDTGSKMADRITETCPADMHDCVHVLLLPDGIKDANELWQREGANAERFRNALAQCAQLPLAAAPTRTLQPISAKQLLQQPAPEQQYLWSGILPQGAIALLAGREKGRGGKTTLAFGIIRAMLRNEPFLGRETQRTRVLYISEENSASLRNKLHALHIDSDDLLILPREAFGANLAHALKRNQDALLQLCTAENIGLVVVDTFQAFGGLRGDAENQVGSVMDALAPLFGVNARGVTVLLIHHHAKATSEPRGSTALTAAVDVVINLTRQQGDNRDNARLLAWEGRWGLGELIYTYDTDTAEFHAAGTPEEHELATLQQRVLELLQNATEPLTEKQISDQLQAPRQRVNIALHRLLEANRIQREGEGKRNAPYRYSFLHSVNIGSGMNAETREEEEAASSSHGIRFCTHMRACTKHAETKSGADSVSALTPGAILMGAHAQTEEALSPLHDTADSVSASTPGAIYVDAHAQTEEAPSPLHDTSVMLDWERGVRTREQHKRKLRNGHDSAYASAQHTLPL